jgi:hypothetical protein
MSYYFAIVGTKDNPLFELEFGTSKHGGDGIARFRDEARHMNQFIVHSSIDIVEEVQWTNGCMYDNSLNIATDLGALFIASWLSYQLTIVHRYHKCIDRFYNNYISLFLTGSNAKFILLHCPDPSIIHPPTPGIDSSTAISNRASRNLPSILAPNPTSPATEEAIRQFFAEAYESWVKAIMNPFYTLDMPVKSPVFRQRVVAAGRKYL